jgi:putative transposase
MKKSNFTEEQIVGVLKEVEAGAKVAETCRKYGIAEATYYKWKTRYAGLEVSQLRRMKDLESECARRRRCTPSLPWSITPFAMSSQKSSKPG